MRANNIVKRNIFIFHGFKSNPIILMHLSLKKQNESASFPWYLDYATDAVCYVLAVLRE